MSERIKCKFCDFTFARFRTTKTGEVKTGISSLKAHIETNHFNEWMEMMEKLESLPESEARDE